MKTHVLLGERIARDAKLRLGASAVIFNQQRKVLLTRRADNDLWCLPGGAMEAGESISEACAREVWEETGLQVEVIRLIGVYSDPHRVVVYPDGKKVHIVTLNFEVTIIGGELGLSDETTEFGYFSLEEAAKMELISNHFERVRDVLLGETAAIIK